MMDKLGLLSLQVPILATSTPDTADGSSSVFIAAAEALPPRYVSPHPEAATDICSGRPSQRRGVAATKCQSQSRAAADFSSSSCASCIWDDNTTTNNICENRGNNTVSATGGIDFWETACSKPGSPRKREAKRNAVATTLACCPSLSRQQQDPEDRIIYESHTQEPPQTDTEPGYVDGASPNHTGSPAATGDKRDEGDSTWRKKRDDFKQDNHSSSHVKDSCAGGDGNNDGTAAVIVDSRNIVETQASESYSEPTAGRKNSVVLNMSAQATATAAAERALAETSAAAPETSVFETEICNAASKIQVEDSPELPAAGSCNNKFKAASADDNVCGTGTPTTRFSTEQEEDGAAPPAVSHRDGTASAGTTGVPSTEPVTEEHDTCSSGEHSAVASSGGIISQSPPYGGGVPTRSSSGDVRFGDTDEGALATEKMRHDEYGQQSPHHGRDSRALSWHTHSQRGTQEEMQRNAVRIQTQKGPQFCHDVASLQNADPFLPDDGSVGELLAAAAAVVEHQVQVLSGAGSNTIPPTAVSQKSRNTNMRSEDSRVLASVTPSTGGEPAERGRRTETSAFVCSSTAPTPTCFEGVAAIHSGTVDGSGAAATAAAGCSTGGPVVACIQSEQQAAASKSQTNEVASSLTDGLDTALLGTSQDGTSIISNNSGTSSSSNSTSTLSRDERTLAVAETGDNSESSIINMQPSSKKQTPPNERIGASQSLHERPGSKGSTANAAGGAGGTTRGTGARGGVGAATQQQQQQTNGSSSNSSTTATSSGGYAADLPEDPELVECLKSLLAALPRKKDAEARWLLSGEMRFVRPYALQIVDVWKIHLGEAGRTALKKDISERTQADAALKRRVLAISKLKMATLEELVQIAELADLLVRTLQIANVYEADRQVASVTRQSASRRALNAAVTALPSQSPSVCGPSNSYYVGGNGSIDAPVTALGTSNHIMPVVSLSSGNGGGSGGGNSGRNATATCVQLTTNTRQNSSYTPSRASLHSSVSPPPADGSPQGPHRLESVSPRCRSHASSTGPVLSPRGGVGPGSSGLVKDEYSGVSSDEPPRFCQKSSPPSEGSCSGKNSSSSTPIYDSHDSKTCARAAGLSGGGLPISSNSVSRKNGGARSCSPSGENKDDVLYHFGGVPDSADDGGNATAQHLQHQQHLQQQQYQHRQLQHVVPQQQQERGLEQPFSNMNEEETRCTEADVTLVADELRETLNILQQQGNAARMSRGKDIFPPPTKSAKAGGSRSGMMSPAKKWGEKKEKTGLPELQQGGSKKMMLSQSRRSPQTADSVEKDEEAIHAAELLAAFADLRSSVAPSSHSHHQTATDISSSSTMAHDDLLNITLEAAAAGVGASPRSSRALAAALSDNHRLSRMLDLSALSSLDSSGGARRGVPQEQEVLTLLRVAALSGDEAAATALAGRLLCVASQGSTSNSSSSSEAEGAALQELDCELRVPTDHQGARRKRARRSNKSGARNGNRNRNAASNREVRLDDNDTLLLQQLHQQLQQLQQQQLLQSQQAPGEDLSAALEGEVQACMNALEAEAAGGKEDPLTQGVVGEKLYCKKKRSCQVIVGGEDKLRHQKSLQDEDTEEEDSSQSKAAIKNRAACGRPETAALLQCLKRNNGRHSCAGRPADSAESNSENVLSTVSGMQSDIGRKGTCPREDDLDRHAKLLIAKKSALFNAEKEGSIVGAADVKANSKGPETRLPRGEEGDNGAGGSNGAGRCSEERTIPTDAADEVGTDGASRSGSIRPTVGNDIDLDLRSNTTSRSASRGGSYRCNTAVDTFSVVPAENNTACHRGRNGVRQGKDNFWTAAHYATRRSAAATSGSSASEVGELGFAEAAKNGGNSNGDSRSPTARMMMQCDSEGKVQMMEKTDRDAGSMNCPRDSVAEQCAREAKQLLERAFKVNDALGFVPASCRLMNATGIPRDQETNNTGGNSSAGTRAKRAREQIPTGEWDTGAFLQVLATVCLMSLKARCSGALCELSAALEKVAAPDDTLREESEDYLANCGRRQELSKGRGCEVPGARRELTLLHTAQLLAPLSPTQE